MRKRLVLSFLSVLLLLFTNLNAQVYNGNLTLSTQAEINAFSYTSVTGTLLIKETTLGNITNLNGLSALTSVGGDLTIQVTSLTDIGLNNLNSVGGKVNIDDNNYLLNISGLNALTTIGQKTLDLSDNFRLVNISGLNDITSLDILDLSDDDGLEHIDGLNGLTSITGDLNVNSLFLLTDINGFSNLISIGGDLVLQYTSLTDIGLNNVNSVGGGVYIDYNNYLLNISGLNSLTTIGQKTLDLSDNFRLVNISGLNGITSLDILDLSDDDGLEHIDGLNGLTSITGNLYINSLFLLTDINGFGNLISIGGDLVLQYTSLTDIGLNNLNSVGGGVYIDHNSFLSNITGLNALTTIGEGTLSLSDNTRLVNISGLNGITSLDVLDFTDDDGLGQIDGLNGLTSITGDLNLIGFPSLTDFNGFSNLMSIGGDLNIMNNEMLTNFCGLYTLLYNNGLAGTYTVTGNAANPTIAEIIAAGGQAPLIANASVSSAMLAPPNHRMRDITVEYSATAACGPVTTVLSVSSNESINGTGDGDTDPDWIIVDNHHVKLRAERSANGNGRIYTITITAINLVGVVSTKTIEVRVAHNITDPHSGKAFLVNSTVNFSGEFWDKPTNKHTAKWLIDDNTTVKGVVTEPTANKNGKVTGSYRFTSPGVYKLQMNTIDQNNITSYANTNGDLEAIVVIYDPNGGNTYGGGYYNSPPGALKSNPSATGKASYGFAMNYFKNSTNPKGETQFEFKVGEFEFNALNFDYLVISNSMAQFKGTGKIIGGQSGVGFTMTVTDGQLDGSGVDKIRMKIYNKNNGTIIYDNQPGASDAALPTLAVGTNSTIVISGTNSSLTSANTNQKAEIEASVAEVSNELDVNAFPNPSANNFTINVKANSNKAKITMQVIDMYGRIIETRNVSANSTIRFGDSYSPGTYLVTIMQGKEHKEIKLIKLSD